MARAHLKDIGGSGLFLFLIPEIREVPIVVSFLLVKNEEEMNRCQAWIPKNVSAAGYRLAMQRANAAIDNICWKKPSRCVGGLEVFRQQIHLM